MSAFEFVFTFYSVMLGLAAANVGTGFADMWRDRRAIEVGVCAPLLAAIVLVATMNLWLRFWRSWDGVEVGPWALITLVAFALPLVFLSRAMFPGAGSTTSLEDHFFQHRRVMLAALAATPGFSLVWYAANGDLTPEWPTIWLVIRFAAPLVLMVFAGRTANRLGLALILVWMLVGLFR
ncbi:hypothetical protein [Brevundimonas sp.]|uniref:hypothetical protein n=1 Tax=Brevundimonas sp. TaxID=1871086 RepID=UPI00391CF8E3